MQVSLPEGFGLWRAPHACEAPAHVGAPGSLAAIKAGWNARAHFFWSTSSHTFSAKPPWNLPHFTPCSTRNWCSLPRCPASNVRNHSQIVGVIGLVTVSCGGSNSPLASDHVQEFELTRPIDLPASLASVGYAQETALLIPNHPVLSNGHTCMLVAVCAITC